MDLAVCGNGVSFVLHPMAIYGVKESRGDWDFY